MNELIAPLLFAAIVSAGVPLQSRTPVKRCCPQDTQAPVQVEVRRGEHLPRDESLRMHVIANWQVLGLRQPMRGYQWVHVGDRYALVSTSTGIVRQVRAAL